MESAWRNQMLNLKTQIDLEKSKKNLVNGKHKRNNY